MNSLSDMNVKLHECDIAWYITLILFYMNIILHECDIT